MRGSRMSRGEVEIPFNRTEGRDVYSGRKRARRRGERYGAEAGMMRKSWIPRGRLVLP